MENTKKIDRHRVWRLWTDGVMPIDIADELSLHYAYVIKLVKLWEGCERMQRIKDRNSRYLTKIVVKEKTILEKISEQVSFSNPFVLISTNEKVYRAYQRMINNRNTDIPM
jgi:hypothetical protein